MRDGVGQACRKSEIDRKMRLLSFVAEQFGKAGESRWFDNYRELPMINDGGCIQIEVIFDQRSQKIISAMCNGFG